MGGLVLIVLVFSILTAALLISRKISIRYWQAESTSVRVNTTMDFVFDQVLQVPRDAYTGIKVLDQGDNAFKVLERAAADSFAPPGKERNIRV